VKYSQGFCHSPLRCVDAEPQIVHFLSVLNYAAEFLACWEHFVGKAIVQVLILV
jgi:hypothetical protein